MEFAFNGVLPRSLRDDPTAALQDVLPTQVLAPDGSVCLGRVPDGNTSFELRSEATGDTGLPSGSFLVFSAPRSSSDVQRQLQVLLKLYQVSQAAWLLFAAALFARALTGAGRSGTDSSGQQVALFPHALYFSAQLALAAIGVTGMRNSRPRLLAVFAVLALIDLAAGLLALRTTWHVPLYLVQLLLLLLVRHTRSLLLSHWFAAVPPNATIRH